MAGYGSFDTMIAALETAASSAAPFICGEQFTAADVYLGSQIGWGMQFGTIEKRPAFEDYWARLSDRPAYKRATEIDNGLIAAAQGASA